MHERLAHTLRTYLANIGRDGGAMTPAVYDTAIAIQFRPQWSDSHTVDWLLSQQRSDGGWDDPYVPRARTVPTLSAVLALAPRIGVDHEAIRAGAQFLIDQEVLWSAADTDELPAGVELIVPWLLRSAHTQAIHLPVTYQGLREVSERRINLIRGQPLHAGSPVAYSWEALGVAADPCTLDADGSIASSPAATVAWLAAAESNPKLADACAAAQRYLEGAHAATATAIPGILPTAWKINRFEQSFGLYFLMVAGLLHDPCFEDLVHEQINNLRRALRPDGIGYSDTFLSDGDDTAAVIAVLASLGLPYDIGMLQRYRVGEHYTSYVYELQAARSVTARAIHALALVGADHDDSVNYLLRYQLEDGRWGPDKWHTSWVYGTAHALFALAVADRHACCSIDKAVYGICAVQHADGGWGERRANLEETSYIILALHALRRTGRLPANGHAALRRACAWMRANPNALVADMPWIAKSAYRPRRLVEMIACIGQVLAEREE
jgi:hypothetical protein